MNIYQLEKFFQEYQKKHLIQNIAPLTVSEEWLHLEEKFTHQMPPEGTKFPEQEEIMKDLSKWYMGQNPSFGFGSAGPAAEKKAEVKEEKKEEKVVQVILIKSRKKLMMLNYYPSIQLRRLCL